MVVSGTGVDSSITVTTVTDQQNIVISSAQSIANDVALTFTAPDSVNTTYIVDTITGTIATGLTVVGSGIADGVTVTGFTASTSTITLSTGLDLTENLELTFKKTYTIASGGVSFSSANKSATLTLTGALASSPTDQALVEFGNTSDTIEGSKINPPSYGTVLVAGGSQSGTGLDVDGVTKAPQVGDTFTIAGVAKVYAVTAVGTVSSGAVTLTVNPALASSPANDAAITFLSRGRPRSAGKKHRFAQYRFAKPCFLC